MNKKTIFTSIITSTLTILTFMVILTWWTTSKIAYVHAIDSGGNFEKVQQTHAQAHQVNLIKSKSPQEVDFVLAANQSVNAVVHINTKSTKAGKYYYNPINDYFFGKPYQKSPDKTVSGSGSGVIISSDGYIATNYHVIKGADIIEVTLNDKRIIEAELIGKDPNTDLALLKISENDLASISYANSDDLQVGEWVLAVGNPFNLTSTVTAGIVSAKGRNINLLKEQYAIESFIQTDAVVNPGNSGGALVNDKGELVGINTAIASNTGSYTGYSFAIPVNVVKKVMNDLRDYGAVQRALLGIQIRDINQSLRTKLNLTSMKGVYISRVMEKGAARLANLYSGDIITHLNGKKVNSINELQEALSQFGPGDEIDVVFLRGDKIKSAVVALKGLTYKKN